MKKSNPFLILGATGFLITLFIHILLYISANASFGFMMSFYPIWIVFLAIGWNKNNYKLNFKNNLNN